ncbi:FixH family protein [Aestuariispira insulae]|nr:FixH family protein [Aestuariispira insulae]
MTQSPNKRSIIPYYFVAFFLVVLIANIIMIYIALSSWTGLETKNHYVKGLQYNEALHAQAKQDALGWTSQASLEVISGLSGKLIVQMGQADGEPLTHASVLVKIIRPTHHGFDQDLKLVETTPGQYEGQVTLPLSGNWDLKQIVVRGEDSFQKMDRIFVEEKADQ